MSSQLGCPWKIVGSYPTFTEADAARTARGKQQCKVRRTPAGTYQLRVRDDQMIKEHAAAEVAQVAAAEALAAVCDLAFPANRSSLLARAHAIGSPATLIAQLKELPWRDYKDAAAVEAALRDLPTA